MIRIPPIFRLRIGLILFSVLVLLAGSWAPMPVAGSTVTMVICSDGAMKTVRVDGQGDHRNGPHECRHCQACNVPMPGPVPPAFSTQRADWRPAAPARPAAVAALPWRADGGLARGPPFPSSRSRTLAAALPQGPDGCRANARTVPA